MLSHLQEKHDAIIALHQTHRESVLALQAILRDEVLPRLVEELGLDDPCSQWARQWIDDYGSIFRILKKHAFGIAEANAALERTLEWRISQLAPFENDNVVQDSPESFIKCLPSSVYDVFGRPVLLIQLANLADASDVTKQQIVQAHEQMRRRLRSEHDRDTILQCVMIVDVKDVAIRSMPVELIPWFVREVAPRFPGMCAAVFVVNYSWAYGMYNFVKRLLPANVLARIYFPSESELLSCFESDCLPIDYGGDLNMSLFDPASASFNILAEASISPMQNERPSDPPPPNINLSHFLPSMSTLNPYFGYPAISGPGSSVPYLKNGRRRKRDLARTLALLWLAKLKRLTDKTWLWIILALALWAFGLRKYK